MGIFLLPYKFLQLDVICCLESETNCLLEISILSVLNVISMTNLSVYSYPSALKFLSLYFAEF